MTLYQLNMAKDFVISLQSRRKWRRWVLVYFLAMGAVIALTLHDVIRQNGVWQAHRKVLDQQERRILSAQPGYRTVAEYRLALDQKMATDIRDLNAVLAFTKKELPVAKLLAGLMEPLPPALN